MERKYCLKMQVLMSLLEGTVMLLKNVFTRPCHGYNTPEQKYFSL